MSEEIIDRSLNHSETILLDFCDVPVFLIPAEMSLKEVVAHLLTPSLEDKELGTKLEKLLAAAENKAPKNQSSQIEVFLNGEKIDTDTILLKKDRVKIEVRHASE
jgi:hypothetical protein